jgi:hypothetical protein
MLGPGQPTKEEFLRHVRGYSLAGINKKIAQEQSNTAIRCRVVGIRQSSRGQIAAYSRWREEWDRCSHRRRCRQ